MKKKILSNIITLIIFGCFWNTTFASAGTVNKLYVDSNTYSAVVANETKNTNYGYGAFYLTQMYNKQGQVASNYKQLYVRFQNSGNNAIEKLCSTSGAHIYLNSVKTIVAYKDEKAIFIFKSQFRKSGTRIKVTAKGHDPSLDCMINATYNIDRKTDQD